MRLEAASWLTPSHEAQRAARIPPADGRPASLWLEVAPLPAGQNTDGRSRGYTNRRADRRRRGGAPVLQVDIDRVAQTDGRSPLGLACRVGSRMPPALPPRPREGQQARTAK